MPFFYSQYLKDEKPRGGAQYAGGLAGGSGIPRMASKPKASTVTTSRSGNRRIPSTPTNAPRRGKLVWHSNIGASAKQSKAPSNNFEPLRYSGDAKTKKVVHFATIEVQPFRFNWELAKDVFYTRAELTAMGQSRFDDAAKVRQKRHLDERGGKGKGTVDDLGMSKRTKAKSIENLLATALEDDDNDEDVSIRGIEHFVYPDLQQEMIRRKKQVQREVLGFVRSKRPDPQGWRLAEHSRSFSQWARNVALEKGMKYCINNAAGDPDVQVSADELQRFAQSSDEMDSLARTLRGSSSFSKSFSGGSLSFDAESPSNRSSELQGIAEIEKERELGDSFVSQPAGGGTGEA